MSIININLPGNTFINISYFRDFNKIDDYLRKKEINIETLFNSHKGEKLYIVGKGRSILNLTSKHFKNGVILTINEAIITIRKLKLSNIIYTMQKDRGTVEPIEPERLLLHEHESKDSFSDYKKRYIFDNVKMGLRWDHPSAMSATMLAHKMGFDCVYYYGFDSIVNNCQSVINGYSSGYLLGVALLQALLKVKPFKEYKIFKPDEI